MFMSNNNIQWIYLSFFPEILKMRNLFRKKKLIFDIYLSMEKKHYFFQKCLIVDYRLIRECFIHYLMIIL